MDSTLSRRGFLQSSATLGLGFMLGAAAGNQSATSNSGRLLKVGFVGIGARGGTLLKCLLKLPGVAVTSLCDIREDRLERAVRWVQEADQKAPSTYGRDETDFKRLCAEEELDLVINATPWRWHTPICVSAMENGKHCATEVPAAVTLEESWRLVETAEKHQRYCMMLEQYIYFQQAMLVTHMVRKGLFGELLHVEGRCQENWIQQNWHVFNSDGTLGWNGEQLATRNGSQYPTHPLGPMALWANINRGDRWDYLVSMSSKSRSLNLSAAEHFGKDHPLAQRKYQQGDANITLLRTANGVTMTLYFGGCSPQPWSPEHKVQGTKGVCIGDLFDYRGDAWLTSKISFAGQNRWKHLSDYAEEHQHPLWQKLGGEAQQRKVRNWSGAYDYLMLHQLTQSLRHNQAPPLDVYDAASWSAIAQLTERSVAKHSAAIDVPDFTRGKWKNNQPIDLKQTYHG